MSYVCARVLINFHYTSQFSISVATVLKNDECHSGHHVIFGKLDLSFYEHHLPAGCIGFRYK